MFSCSSDSSENTVINNTEPNSEKVDFETLVKRHVEASLEIPSTEKYTMEIYKHKMNEDDIEDAVVLVNREEFAMKEAEASPNLTQRASTGFMGKYNFVFYFDGAKDRLTQPIPMASSAIHPLKIKFKPIQTEGYDDFIIEYRIRDAGFQSFFTIKSNIPFLVFQWKVYDYLNTPDQECIYLGTAEGSRSLAKDILVFEGKFKGKVPNMQEEMTATIENTGRLKYRFFYEPKLGKYATSDKKVETPE